MIYIDCSPHQIKGMLERYPSAVIVPNEGYLWVKAPGIREALHNVYAPQSGVTSDGKHWKVLSCTYYHSIIEIIEK